MGFFRTVFRLCLLCCVLLMYFPTMLVGHLFNYHSFLEHMSSTSMQLPLLPELLLATTSPLAEMFAAEMTMSLVPIIFIAVMLAAGDGGGLGRKTSVACLWIAGVGQLLAKGRVAWKHQQDPQFLKLMVDNAAVPVFIMVVSLLYMLASPPRAPPVLKHERNGFDRGLSLAYVGLMLRLAAVVMASLMIGLAVMALMATSMNDLVPQLQFLMSSIDMSQTNALSVHALDPRALYDSRFCWMWSLQFLVGAQLLNAALWVIVALSEDASRRRFMAVRALGLGAAGVALSALVLAGRARSLLQAGAADAGHLRDQLNFHEWHFIAILPNLIVVAALYIHSLWSMSNDNAARAAALQSSSKSSSKFSKSESEFKSKVE